MTYFRKVIQIKAEHSPNVKAGILAMQQGLVPPSDVLVQRADQPWGILTQAEYDALAAKWEGSEAKARERAWSMLEEAAIPGVLSLAEYLKRRATWNPIRQCIGLDAEFYQGPELLMFPALWLAAAEKAARELNGKPRRAKAVGVDGGEGWADTSYAAVDEGGLIELLSHKTPDTSKITGEAIGFASKHHCPIENVIFDRGGGGKQHADRLRSQGFDVRTVMFGDPATPEPSHGKTPLTQQKLQTEERTIYFNRRSEMYGRLHVRLDPNDGPVFGIPGQYTELRRQLSKIPLEYDDEGKLRLRPKTTRDPKDRIQFPGQSRGKRKKTLTELIGRSPDDADAVVLALYGMEHKPVRRRAGALR